MNTSTVTKKVNAIFLVTVLIAGTIAVSSPSFMAGAQAEPYYGMDNNYDKKSNGKDVSVKAIKCNNINVNVNGLELNVLPPVLSGLVGSEAQASDEGERGASSYGSGNGGSYGGGQSSSDGDFKFVCINNNNNTVVGVADGEDGDDDGGVTPPPPDGVTCEECFNANATVASIITEQLALGGPIVVIAPNELVIPQTVTTIAGLCDFLEFAIGSGAIDQDAVDINLVIQAILAAGPAPDPVLSEASLAALIACLLDVDFEIA